jgi:hypothetical protein
MECDTQQISAEGKTVISEFYVQLLEKLLKSA